VNIGASRKKLVRLVNIGVRIGGDDDNVNQGVGVRKATGTC
jgi:hypothetical protein